MNHLTETQFNDVVLSGKINLRTDDVQTVTIEGKEYEVRIVRIIVQGQSRLKRKGAK